MSRTNSGDSANYIEVDSGALGLSLPVTLAGWINCNDITADDRCLIMSGGAYLRVDKSTGKMEFFAGASTVATVNSIGTNEWAHGAGRVWDSPSAGKSSVLNGDIDNMGTSGTSGWTAGASRLGLRVGGSDPLDGLLAWVSAWGVLLTDDEVIALAQGRNPMTVRPDAIVGCWPLWGEHSPEINLAASAYQGDITGTMTADLEMPPVELWTPGRRVFGVLEVGGATTHAAAATLDGVSTLTDDLTTTKPAAATDTGVGDLQNTPSLIARVTSQDDGVATLTDDLTILKQVAATDAGVGNLTGDIDVIHGVQATASGVADLQNTPGLIARTTGQDDGVGSVVTPDAIIQKNAAATDNGVATVTADLTISSGATTWQVSVQDDGVATVTPDLVVTKPAAATGAGVGALAADLTIHKQVSSSSTGVGDVDGSAAVGPELQIVKQVAATIGSPGDVVTPPIVMTMASVATGVGIGCFIPDPDLTTRKFLSAEAVLGKGMVTADLSLENVIEISVALAGIATVTPDLLNRDEKLDHRAWPPAQYYNPLNPPDPRRL